MPHKASQLTLILVVIKHQCRIITQLTVYPLFLIFIVVVIEIGQKNNNALPMHVREEVTIKDIFSESNDSAGARSILDITQRW